MKEDYYVTVGIDHHDNKFDGDIQRFFLKGLSERESKLLWSILKSFETVKKD